MVENRRLPSIFAASTLEYTLATNTVVILTLEVSFYCRGGLFDNREVQKKLAMHEVTLLDYHNRHVYE